MGILPEVEKGGLLQLVQEQPIALVEWELPFLRVRRGGLVELRHGAASAPVQQMQAGTGQRQALEDLSTIE